MSSDNDQIPKSGKRKKLVIPDSEDSDESIVQSHRKKKTYVVISEGESSDEDSVVHRPSIRRQSHRVIAEDDTSYGGSSSASNNFNQFEESSETCEWQSDWSSSSESEKKCLVKRKVLGRSRSKKPPKIVSDTDTDTSDDQVEKCPICLLPFRMQQLGTPSSCEHCFCLECLLEWSKNVNTCPVDRQTFTTIHVRDELGGQITRQVPVEVTARIEDEPLEDPTFCEMCHQSDREDRMLLCDGCDCGYHLECLTPPMNEVPMEEWFCPECSQNSQNDAEAVEIDLDEISDLMEEARRLGVSYGRTRAGMPQDAQPRIVPRTRHTERVRATIRRRNRVYDNPQPTRRLSFDPNQPTTSSGLESYGDNSRSRSPSIASNSLGSGDRNCSDMSSRKSRNTRRFRSSSSESSDESVSTNPKRRFSDGNKPNRSDTSKSKGNSRKAGTASKSNRKSSSKKSGSSSRKSGSRNKSRKSSGRSKNVSSRGTILKEVRITERNEDGEEEEIVTYVKVAAIGIRKKKTKRRKRRRVRRQARTVSSVLASTKKRLAVSLGICKPVKGVPVLVPTVRSRTVLPERSALNSSRYNAGITRLSLLGDGLGLNYSPSGSDTEDYQTSNGPTITIHRRSVMPSRRQLRIKNMASPQQFQTDLLSNIISNQELWHSTNNNVILKADGLLLVEKKESSDGLKKEKIEEKTPTKTEKTVSSVVENRTPTVDAPQEATGINAELITQAPMYNNPCGGGNRGNFRGGYRENTRHSHGGQNYGRDSLPGSGRHSYGGSGSNFGRDFGPPAFYNPNFEHCGPPMFGGTPPFRNRNPQHFRNERFRFMPPGRPPFNFTEGFEHHSFPERFNRPRSPQPPVERPLNNMPANLPEDTSGNPSVEQQPQDIESVSVRQEEDCDIYCDIETKSDGELQDQQNGSVALLPPPEPPSGLLDFDENSRSDKDSDQELVIDDSHKEDTPKNDKYDPFSVDSDSDSEGKRNEEEEEKKEEKTVESLAQTSEPQNTSMHLCAYDDEDEEDSQADCPNFSIYSSQTIDLARHTEQQLSQQIGPLEPPPLPPSIPDDDDVIVGDVQACDLADIPEPSDPYVEALRKERQALSKIPPKKISNDSRGKITFKIGTKLKINNRLLGLQEEEEKEIEEEKKIESEPKEEETTSIDRAEERKKIAKHKFEDMEVEEDKQEEEIPFEPVIRMDISDPQEKNTDEEPTERESAEISVTDITEIESNVDVPTEATQLFSKKAENELSNECPSELASEESCHSPPVSFPKTSNADVSEGTSISNVEEDCIEAKVKDPEDIENEKDEKGQRRRIGAEEEDEDEEEEEEDEEDEEEDDEDDENKKERFPIEKEKPDKESTVEETVVENRDWESDGAYTPCKDELPLKELKSSSEHLPPIESGLEPITPTKDKPDDFESCRTPVDYNVLGTEAISETDEAMNFEDELTLLTLRKEKEMEDGEIIEEKTAKESEKLEKDREEEKKRKKKEKKEKSKETEKNKENIASENQVAWKKLSKSTKERSYRDKEKRSKSKDKEKPKKKKEMVKKKEKRKELPRYDVRKIVAERPSRPRKDEYGRDIREKSRQRSRSRSLSSKRSRSYSKMRSRSRSRNRIQRSWSRDRRSYSKSLSRRRSLSRGRRKSPKRRSTSRRRSMSRKRSLSRRRSRSVSRKRRSLSRKRSRRSVSRSRRSLSRTRQRRSLSRSRRSLSRSRDRRKDKKKYKSRSRSKNRKRSRSKSPRKSSKSRERKLLKRKAQSRSRSRGRSCSRNWEQVDKIVEQNFPREREERDSWSGQWTPSWSRSRSKTPPHVQQEQITSRDWSPVLDNVNVPPKNLTVILTNKEAIKKKKKERRKESKKGRDEKKRKGKRNRTPPPSKEVFASGDNILVSVCFNKDNENIQTGVPELPETIPLIPPLKCRRREPLQTEPPKRSKKEKLKDKRSKSPKPKKDKKKKSKAAEIAATKKPVAVIDLDQSPFREQTPSPRDVIVLSDDDDKQEQQITPDQCQPSQNSPQQREQFVSQGPKTPPEPQIKFSINKQTSNLRPSMLNPLLDEEEEEEMDERVEEELEMRAQEELELRLKIGPNTPPEPPTSPPTSPDAYDPFDPTKSRSPTPDPSQEANSGDERRRSPRKHDSVDGNILEEETMQKQQERQSQEKQLEKPKIISMVTIKRASPQRDDAKENENNKDVAVSAGGLEGPQSQQNVQNQNNPFSVMNPVLATVAAAVQRSSVFNASNSNTGQRNLLQSNRISPSNQQKQRAGDRSQAPTVFANSGKPRGSKSGQTKNNGQNGNDAAEATDTVDMSSPYSPGSTLSDGIFDPPSPGNFNSSPGAGPAGAGGTVGSQPTKINNSKTTKIADKKDTFDALFGTIPATKTASKPTRSKKSDKDKKKKPTNPKVGVRMDENQLQILDDLPSSAVEMQVKDKFLKKLNRQERVVEEVKLVLKPHYTKKHVTKEEYKDIMRKAVPKICHNKTGEINPKKIAHLIEAYVRKCRNSKKKTTESSSAKASKPTKILWS
ncbi:PREDICTED: serine/arginine repetitive matrix protein 2 isoform X2 [Dufourea novaeangliae]|uniref:serine/arginine repetitive matrix protein 2 isoform X2 n=1 Tax=Dufourea novaeangliae TaxID=178035 RepID=UPI0007674738|nr:PREDICTED: serine/arginine repetitive matrix protein 2 isoform X2 [Dufourea novaeangliae]